jgi:protein-tyrosine phosphatase
MAKTGSAAGEAMEQRFLPIEGVINFRDYGGYRTASGARIKWGRLFRSAGHSNATDAALDAIAKLDVKVVVDLRRPVEREREPSRRPRGFNGLVIESDPGDEAEDSWWSFAAGSDANDGGFRDYLTDYYRRLPFEPRYVDLCIRYFRALGETDGAMLMHCSAGRDRTGLLAALTHRMLQVSEADVVTDYLLSNQAPGMETRVAGLMKRIAQRTGREPSLAAVRAAFMANENYLSAAFQAISAAHGDVTKYLRGVLGVDADLQKKIEARLLD